MSRETDQRKKVVKNTSITSFRYERLPKVADRAPSSGRWSGLQLFKLLVLVLLGLPVVLDVPGHVHPAFWLKKLCEEAVDEVLQLNSGRLLLHVCSQGLPIVRVTRTNENRLLPSHIGLLNGVPLGPEACLNGLQPQARLVHNLLCDTDLVRVELAAVLAEARSQRGLAVAIRGLHVASQGPVRNSDALGDLNRGASGKALSSVQLGIPLGLPTVRQ